MPGAKTSLDSARQTGGVGGQTSGGGQLDQRDVVVDGARVPGGVGEHLGRSDLLDVLGVGVGALVVLSNNHTAVGPDIAVGSSDNPVLVDRGTAAEVEAVGLLQGHLPGPGVWHSLLTVDDAGITSHLGGDGRGAAAVSGADESEAGDDPEESHCDNLTLTPC